MNLRIQDALTARRKQLAEGESQKGFTLIELLVVVIIIGILAAIAIPVFLNLREGAWRSSVESDLKNTALAIESYGIEHNGSLLDLPEGDIPVEGLTAKPSPGNTITIELGAESNTYTITGTNESLGEPELVYSSEDGGLGTWSDRE